MTWCGACGGTIVGPFSDNHCTCPPEPYRCWSCGEPKYRPHHDLCGIREIREGDRVRVEGVVTQIEDDDPEEAGLTVIINGQRVSTTVMNVRRIVNNDD